MLETLSDCTVVGTVLSVSIPELPLRTRPKCSSLLGEVVGAVVGRMLLEELVEESWASRELGVGKSEVIPSPFAGLVRGLKTSVSSSNSRMMRSGVGTGFPFSSRRFHWGCLGRCAATQQVHSVRHVELWVLREPVALALSPRTVGSSGASVSEYPDKRKICGPSLACFASLSDSMASPRPSIVS